MNGKMSSRSCKLTAKTTYWTIQKHRMKDKFSKDHWHPFRQMVSNNIIFTMWDLLVNDLECLA